MTSRKHAGNNHPVKKVYGLTFASEAAPVTEAETEAVVLTRIFTRAVCLGLREPDAATCPCRNAEACAAELVLTMSYASTVAARGAEAGSPR